MYISKEGNDWAEKAALIIGAKHGHDPQEWKGKFLRVSFTFYAKSILTYDVDGKIKICLDCLSRKLGFDDRFVMKLSAQKQKGPSGVLIVLEELRSQNTTPTPHPTRHNQS